VTARHVCENCPPTITREEIIALADAFDRSAAWLLKGELSGPPRTHPLVGIADYQRAAYILRSASWVWAHSDTEG